MRKAPREGGREGGRTWAVKWREGGRERRREGGLTVLVERATEDVVAQGFGHWNHLACGSVRLYGCVC